MNSVNDNKTDEERYDAYARMEFLVRQAMSTNFGPSPKSYREDYLHPRFADISSLPECNK